MQISVVESFVFINAYKNRRTCINIKRAIFNSGSHNTDICTDRIGSHASGHVNRIFYLNTELPGTDPLLKVSDLITQTFSSLYQLRNLIWNRNKINLNICGLGFSRCRNISSQLSIHDMKPAGQNIKMVSRGKNR